MNHLTTTAACAVAGQGLRVNAILPGQTETGLARPMFDWARKAGQEDRPRMLTPLQRPGLLADMASVAAIRASGH